VIEAAAEGLKGATVVLQASAVAAAQSQITR